MAGIEFLCKKFDIYMKKNRQERQTKKKNVRISYRPNREIKLPKKGRNNDYMSVENKDNLPDLFQFVLFYCR